MKKIIGGIILIIAGSSGNYVLIGTSSGIALIVVGVILFIWGIAEMFFVSDELIEEKPKVKNELCWVKDEKMIVYTKTHESLGILTELNTYEKVLIDFNTEYDRFYQIKYANGKVGYILKTAKFSKVSP